MNLADKIKQAYFGGNQADLSKEVSATDVKSVAQVFGRELANSQNTLSPAMMCKAQGLGLSR